MIKLENNYTQDKYLKYAQDVISGKQVAGKCCQQVKTLSR